MSDCETNEEEWNFHQECDKKGVVCGDEGHTTYYDYGDGNGLVAISEEEADRIMKAHLNRKNHRSNIIQCEDWI